MLIIIYFWCSVIRSINKIKRFWYRKAGQILQRIIQKIFLLILDFLVLFSMLLSMKPRLLQSISLQQIRRRRYQRVVSTLSHRQIELISWNLLCEVGRDPRCTFWDSWVFSFITPPRSSFRSDFSCFEFLPCITPLQKEPGSWKLVCTFSRSPCT